MNDVLYGAVLPQTGAKIADPVPLTPISSWTTNVGWMEKAGVEVRFEQHLAIVTKKSCRISEIAMEDGTTYHVSIVVDVNYKGDLFARAGMSYQFVHDQDQSKTISRKNPQARVQGWFTGDGMKGR